MVTRTKAVTIHQPSRIITAFVTNLILKMELNEAWAITPELPLTVVILLQ